jgi:CBS domain-containing protein
MLPLHRPEKEVVMRVENVMTRDVVWVGPELPLRDVATCLVDNGISGVPVCGGDRRVLGVVSEADIVAKERGVDVMPTGALRWLYANGETTAKTTARTAGEAMTAPAVTIAPRRAVSEAAKVMLDRGVNRLPVVVDDRLVGIVTRADLVRAFVRTDAEIAREICEDVLVSTLWIDPAPVTVAVRRGEVTLAGEVGNRSEAELIGAYVSRVPGVIGVDASGLGWRDDDLGRRRSLASVRR